jgi:hypothetical protein
MAQSIFAEIDAVVLEVDHLVDTELAGNPKTLTLHAKSGTGGVNPTPFKTISGKFRRVALNTFGGRIFEFRIAEQLLTADEAASVYAIRYGTRQHSVPDKIDPECDTRYWRFRTRPLQQV